MTDERVIDRDELLELCRSRHDDLVEQAKSTAYGESDYQTAGMLMAVAAAVEIICDEIAAMTKHSRREGEEF